MVNRFEVDQFTARPHFEAFTKQQQVIAETVGVLGLQNAEHPVLIVGSSAFTRQDIDTYVDTRKSSDLDIVAPRDLFMQFHREKRFTGRVNTIGTGLYMGVMYPDKTLPMQVEVFTADDPMQLKFLVGPLQSDCSRYNRAASIDEIEIDGVNVVAAGLLAAGKVSQVPRVKDLAAIVKGHVVAEHTQHPILGDGFWNASVALAIERLGRGDVIDKTVFQKVTRTMPKYPSWLRELVSADFSHPAFKAIARN